MYQSSVYQGGRIRYRMLDVFGVLWDIVMRWVIVIWMLQYGRCLDHALLSVYWGVWGEIVGYVMAHTLVCHVGSRCVPVVVWMWCWDLVVSVVGWYVIGAP